MALHRHKKSHLSLKLKKAHRAREQAATRKLVALQKADDNGEFSSAGSLLDRVLRFQREAEAILADARAGKRDGAALAAIGKLTELLKVEGAAIQAAQAARQSQGCERCERVSAMSPERVEDFLARHRALDYLRDPAGFLESVRNRAAVEISERGRIPVAEARATVEAQEAAAVEKLKERA
jgi:hypothetical protein